LQAALRQLGARDDIFLLVAGRDAEKWCGTVPVDVFPLGYLEDDDALAAAYSAADVVCVPSSVENLPNTVLEAMACARPVVAIDAGGMRDAVRHDETGILCPAGDTAAYAVALQRILDDEPFRHSAGQRSLELIQREFTVKREVEKIRSIYEEILESRMP
jgi:glycosyltransferase involved in cell wall biosynthesis